MDNDNLAQRHPSIRTDNDYLVQRHPSTGMDNDEGLPRPTECHGADDSRSSTTATAHVRDEEYYFDDGNVVFLVEDRLFKIHRSLFARDSPLFRAVFSMPQGDLQGDGVLQGQSDECPIVCQDTVEDFRALCWALYSRPSDILAQQGWETIDLPKLIRVVAMAHKYDMVAYRTWALNALEACSATKPKQFIHKCRTWADAGRIFGLAKRCEAKALAERLEQDWLRRISDKDERTTAFVRALDIAEEEDSSDLLRNFHAKAYHTYLKATGIFSRKAPDATTLGLSEIGSNLDKSLLILTETRRTRLYAGFWSLSQLRLRLSQPPKLAENASCPRHASECIPAWEAWWKDVLDTAVGGGEGLNDPGDLIQKIQQKIAEPIRGKNGLIHCHDLIRLQVEQMARDFDNSLVDRFMIP